MGNGEWDAQEIGELKERVAQLEAIVEVLSKRHSGICTKCGYMKPNSELEAELEDEQLRSDVYDKNFQDAYKRNKKLEAENERLRGYISIRHGAMGLADALKEVDDE